MNSKLFALTSIVALSFASHAYAQQAEVGAIEENDKIISVSGSGYHRTFPCNGRKLEVAGSGHVISTTGECSNVEVSGADNTVEVAIASKGTLEVSGTTNSVRWKSSGKIKQDISGSEHKVTRVK
ncbi:MAG: DUF3060 domain-containing protein [Pseudomonadota bacterium]